MRQGFGKRSNPSASCLALAQSWGERPAPHTSCKAVIAQPGGAGASAAQRRTGRGVTGAAHCAERHLPDFRMKPSDHRVLTSAHRVSHDVHALWTAMLSPQLCRPCVFLGTLRGAAAEGDTPTPTPLPQQHPLQAQPASSRPFLVPFHPHLQRALFLSPRSSSLLSHCVCVCACACGTGNSTHGLMH